MLLLCLQAYSQKQASPIEIKRKWYHSVIRLVKGGDNHYYVLRTRDGHYWSFGRAGQYRFDLLRFDAEFRLVNKLKVRGKQQIPGLDNAFEVLASPEGIAFLSIRRDSTAGKIELQRCNLEFKQEQVCCDCKFLADMSGFVPHLGQPDIRLAWAPDSAIVAISWRENPNHDRNDNATQCILLDRNLQPISRPFSPFPKTKQEFRLKRIGVLDQENLVFVVRTFKTTGLFATPTPGAFHLVAYHLPDSSLREIRLDSSSRTLMDIQLDFSEPGRIRAAGWWLDLEQGVRDAGIFIGELGKGDTLEQIRMQKFERNLYIEMLPKKLPEGGVWFRPSYHNRLLPVKTGFVYVLQLSGQLYPAIPVEHPGDKYDNVLLCFFFDHQGELIADKALGYCNEARTDYRETGSWIPIQTEKELFALVTDFSEIPSLSRSHLASSRLLPISLDTEVPSRKLRPGPESDNLILSPRIHIRESANTYVFLARSKKAYRLIRVKF